MTPDEYRLYQRQIVLPEVGLEGQRKLKELSVLIVGVGGLGCPSALYLATSGIGRIGLVDGDTVEASNLHRQVLYGVDDIGRPKTQVAAERLSMLNPHLKIDQHAEHLNAENAEKLISSYDIILEGSDNFAAKYLVNWVCVRLKKPFVLASVMRSEGQFMVYEPGSACYSCLFPEPPSADLAPNCADAGVLGVVPGIMGLFQAAETLKYVLKIGENKSENFKTFSLSSLKVDSFQIAKDQTCRVCLGTAGKPQTLDVCETVPDPLSDSVSEFKKRLVGQTPPVLLDVRSEQEFAGGSIAGAQNVDWETFQRRFPDKNQAFAVFCLKGVRSRKFIERMLKDGYSNVRHLRGGILAWLIEFGEGK